MENANYLKKDEFPINEGLPEGLSQDLSEDLSQELPQPKKKMTPEELKEFRLNNIRAYQWQPGQAPNPTGRPVGSKTKALVAKKWLEMAEESINEITGVQEVLTQEDLITLAMIKRAKKGDVKAYKELLNAAFGEEKNINHSGNLGIANITGMEII